jgi:hypothetical protein
MFAPITLADESRHLRLSLSRCLIVIAVSELRLRDSIPQKFSGLSKSNPSSHEVSSMTGMARTIRPFLLRPFETSFTVTGVSNSPARLVRLTGYCDTAVLRF